MPYNSLVSRTNATPLIPEEFSREILQLVPQASAIMRLGRRLPNMTRAQLRMPVLSALATAYFVDGDTGLKQTTNIAWQNKYINIGEIAAIVPVPSAVLDDVDYDLWTEIRPRLVEAIGIVFDQAVLYGTNAPSDWPTSILAGAVAASQTVDYSNLPAGALVDLYDAILSDGGTNSMVEVDGFMVTGYIAAMVMKSRLRGLRDSNGQPIFMQSMQQAGNYTLDGMPVDFPINGAIDVAQSLVVAGQWDQLVYALRQDITFDVATQAVIQDSAGNIIYNTFQQDMVAMRAVMRLGWQLPNPISRLNQVEATRFPFSVLVP